MHKVFSVYGAADVVVVAVAPAVAGIAALEPFVCEISEIGEIIQLIGKKRRTEEQQGCSEEEEKAAMGGRC